jgi:23S rRNA (adenine2503-C2)-methyltransferase
MLPSRPSGGAGQAIALQAALPDELVRALGIDLTDARRIVSLAHRAAPCSALPARSPATIRKRVVSSFRSSRTIWQDFDESAQPPPPHGI